MTPAFAAPEQLTGGKVTTATDVYALGVLLYILLGGQHPAGPGFKSPAELIELVVNSEAPRLSEALTRTKTTGGDDALTTMAVAQGDVAGPLAPRAEGRSRDDRRHRAEEGSARTVSHGARRWPTTCSAISIGGRFAPARTRSCTVCGRSSDGILPAVVAAAAGLVLVSGLITFYTIRLQAERDRAQLEAAKAAQMTQFMTGLLHASDPYADRAREGEPTVRELLDAGAARVERELAGRPELQADIMTEIGRVYQRLRLDDKARPILEKALVRAREADGPSSARVAQSLNHLGVQMRDEDWQRSVALLKEALAMRRQVLGNEDAKVAITLVELGRTYVDRGMAAEAEPLLRESLAIRRKVFGNVHREVGHEPERSQPAPAGARRSRAGGGAIP